MPPNSIPHPINTVPQGTGAETSGCHNSAMVMPLPNHSGIRGRTSCLRTEKLRHNSSTLSSNAPQRLGVGSVQGPVGPLQDDPPFPSLPLFFTSVLPPLPPCEGLSTPSLPLGAGAAPMTVRWPWGTWGGGGIAPHGPQDNAPGASPARPLSTDGPTIVPRPRP